MSAIATIRIQRTREPLGYKVNGEQRRGYQDDPALDDASRRKLALWARATGEASPQQLEIIQRSNPSPEDTPGRVAAREALAPSASPFWDLLSKSEQEIVMDPSIAGAGNYPLSMKDLTRLTGATNDQARFWADNGLIKAHKSAGGHRRFFSEALLRSYFCAPLSKQDVAVLLKILNSPSPGLLAVLSALLDQKAVAEPKQELGDAFRESARGLRVASRCISHAKVAPISAASAKKPVNRQSTNAPVHAKSVKRSAKSGTFEKANTRPSKPKPKRKAKTN